MGSAMFEGNGHEYPPKLPIFLESQISKNPSVRTMCLLHNHLLNERREGGGAIYPNHDINMLQLGRPTRDWSGRFNCDGWDNSK